MHLGAQLKKWVPLALLALTSAMPAYAIDVSGVNVAEVTSVAGKELKLNGAGMRSKFFIKIYAMGLYLPEKKTTAAEVQALAGSRRVTLHLQREVNGDELGQSFLSGLNKNSTDEEKTKVMAQTNQFAKMFTTLEPVKKGDIVTLDWIPDTGTVTSLNGKKIGETLPDVAFYNAVLRIWLGDSPAQDNLKNELLGSK
jgi:hypothetical protein